MHCEVRLVGAVHPNEAEELAVRGRKRAQAHERERGWKACELRQLAEERASALARIDDPAPAIEERSLRRHDQGERLLKARRVGIDLRTIGLVLHRGRRLVAT